MHYLSPKKEIEEHERDWAVGALIEGYCCHCAHDTTHEVTAIEGLLIAQARCEKCSREKKYRVPLGYTERPASSDRYEWVIVLMKRSMALIIILLGLYALYWAYDVWQHPPSFEERQARVLAVKHYYSNGRRTKGHVVSLKLELREEAGEFIPLSGWRQAPGSRHYNHESEAAAVAKGFPKGRIIPLYCESASLTKPHPNCDYEKPTTADRLGAALFLIIFGLIFVGAGTYKIVQKIE